MERECKTAQRRMERKDFRLHGEPDQAEGFLGIRDLNYMEEFDGQFIEFSTVHGRRDPEESQYNEAGQKLK
jgi:hypothetical protein